MDGHGHDRQVEVVKHDIDLLVDASVKAKVQSEGAAADILESARVLRTGEENMGMAKLLLLIVTITLPKTLAIKIYYQTILN